MRAYLEEFRMPFFVTSNKIWPIGLGFVLLVFIIGLDMWECERLSSAASFFVVLVMGVIILAAMLKDARSGCREDQRTQNEIGI